MTLAIGLKPILAALILLASWANALWSIQYTLMHGSMFAKWWIKTCHAFPRGTNVLLQEKMTIPGIDKSDLSSYWMYTGSQQMFLDALRVGSFSTQALPEFNHPSSRLAPRTTSCRSCHLQLWQRWRWLSLQHRCEHWSRAWHNDWWRW